MFPGCVCSVCTWLQVYMCAHIFVHHIPMLAPVMSMHQACMHIYSVEFKCVCYGAYPCQACMFQSRVCTRHACVHMLYCILCLCVPTAPPIHEVELVVLHPVNGHSPHGISCWLPRPSLRSVLGRISVEGRP